MNSKYNMANVNLRKVLKLSFLINLIQLVLMIMVIIYATKNPAADMYALIYLSAILTAFNSTLTALGYYFILYTKRNSILDTVKNLEDLNSKLREQRHDYLNHIQVIYGLMELDELEEAKKYIEPVYKDILKVSKALRTAHPAVNALLQAKMQMAEKYEVNVYLEVKTDLGQMNIEAWELCKVVSNIIDNGILALSEKEGDKNLYINISDELDEYRIDIYNNGPSIPASHIKAIFEEGFTTKKEEGHGMGLAIVQNILEKVGGGIKASSREGETCFNICIPKK
ncbi:MAG: Spo0B domain-containing protein [Cellulosilyticaceae bacterium]